MDRGDRALERVDEEHPGLADDQVTEMSHHASELNIDPPSNGRLLALDFEPDGSFVDVSSHQGFMHSEHEESKRPDIEAISNVMMSAETNRV